MVSQGLVFLYLYYIYFRSGLSSFTSVLFRKILPNLLTLNLPKCSPQCFAVCRMVLRNACPSEALCKRGICLLRQPTDTEGQVVRTNYTTSSFSAELEDSIVNSGPRSVYPSSSKFFIILGEIGVDSRGSIEKG